MKTYTLKLSSGRAYRLYDGLILVSDADLAALFGTAGEAYFVFDFNSLVPSSDNELEIIDSNDTAVIEDMGIDDGTIKENYTYKGTWSTGVLTFDYFGELRGKALSEAELSFLMGEIKNAGEVKIGSVLSTPSNVDYVGTNNITDSAVTTPKIAAGAVTKAKIDFSGMSGNYSTTEEATEYTWINGEVIYKKTVDLGEIPNNTGKDVAHGITNLGMFIKYEGIVYKSDGTAYPLPLVSKTNYQDQIELQLNSTNVNLLTGTTYWYTNNFNAYITLYYIKSS